MEREITNSKDPDALKDISRKYSKLKKIKDLCDELKDLIDEREAWRELTDDEVEDILKDLDQKISQKTRLLLEQILSEDLSKDGVVVEIRAGTGGEEAALFAADLYRMYTRYAERKGWKIELVDFNKTDLNGFKEIVFFVRGRGAYAHMKYEAGVHRVQRVPVTESGGRIHTSAATVAILPEVNERDVSIDPSDIRIDTFKASGHGGQYVNKTESAVRITHIPTGIVVSIQTERSQHRNRELAMSILRSKLYQLEREKRIEELSNMRRSQIGTGDRSEKIRTYNFPQNRVTDHRINYTTYRLEEVLDGDLDEIIGRLMLKDLEERISGGGIFEDRKGRHKEAVR